MSGVVDSTLYTVLEVLAGTASANQIHIGDKIISPFFEHAAPLSLFGTLQ